MLTIQISRRNDGSGLLRCIRSDGTITWQKQSSRQAPFFALHDLTHYALESTLGYKRGFYGLIAEGWDIEDTTGKGKRGGLPDEALEVESLVGMLDMERASGTLWTAQEVYEHVAQQNHDNGRPAPRPLTQDDLIRVRARRSQLFQQWSGLQEGSVLELRLER